MIAGEMHAATETTTHNSANRPSAGKWVTEAVYSDHTSISRQSLTNWRYKDKLAGRTTAPPGYPVYRRFGRAIRYWLDVSDQLGAGRA